MKVSFITLRMPVAIKVRLTIFGRPLFGGILPFIGFRNFPITDEGMPIVSGREGKPSGWYSDVFIIEWIFFTFVIFTTTIKRNY